MATKTIYLVRHGQQNRDQASDELGGVLTEIGISQAKLTGEYLCQMPFTSMHSSTMRRARQTAEEIAVHHPDATLQTNKLLWECMPTIPPELKEAVTDISPQKLEREQRRIVHTFDTYFVPAAGDEDEHVLLVCHGNLIRYFVTRVLQTPPDMWINMEIRNCGISRIEIKRNGSMVLIAHNETGHLPDELKTFL